MSDLNPWWRGDDHVGGIRFARFLAWSALAIGVTALCVALFVPLAGQLSRTAWITGFGTAAMWVAFLAVPRYRAEGIRRSPVVVAAMAVGALTIAIMIYAFIAIALRPTGVELPVPPHWLGDGSVPPTPDRVPT